MGAVVATLVVKFGESAASASGAIVAEWDDSRNLDGDGNVKSQWLAGEQAWLRVHHDDTVRILSVRVTDGNIRADGDSAVAVSDELGWGDADDVQLLTYLPAGPIGFNWYGRAGRGHNLEGRALTIASGFPCLADVSYMARFSRYVVTLPAVVLSGEATWKLRAYVYYQEIGA